MKILIFFSLIVCAVSQQYPIVATDSNCGKGTPLFRDENRIVGGSVATKGNFGWTVAIYQNGQLICGGALITSQWVATSAYCVFGKDASTLSVDIGVQDRNSWDQWSVNRRVLRFIINPNYQQGSFRNDIAMIKLASPVSIDIYYFRIVPVCVPSGLENYEGRYAWLTGYGSAYSGGPSSRYLMQVQTRILTDTNCRIKFNGYYSIDSYTQLCAGESFQNQDFCEYDNGGPLVAKGNDGRWHLVGIASFGRNPCGSGGVYTRVSYFSKFITDTMNYN